MRAQANRPNAANLKLQNPSPSLARPECGSRLHSTQVSVRISRDVGAVPVAIAPNNLIFTGMIPQEAGNADAWPAIEVMGDAEVGHEAVFDDDEFSGSEMTPEEIEHREGRLGPMARVLD